MRVGTILGSVFFFLVFLLVAGVVGYFVFTSGWAPLGFFAVLWFLSMTLFLADVVPWERTRVAIALLSAWLADWFLYRIAVVWLPGSFRHFVPGIVVVSVYIGYVVWRMTERWPQPDPPEPPKGGRSLNKGMAALAGALLAIFVMVNVVVPVLNHYLPSYWSNVTSAFFGSFDENPDDNPDQ